MKIFRHILCALMLMASPAAFSQDGEMTDILDTVGSRLDKISAYTVDAIFSVDIDFVHMPDKQAVIRFEAPDKLDIDADGFLMIPRMGLKPLSRQLNLDYYHSLYLGKVLLDQDSCYQFKLIPKDSKHRIVLATVWISRDYRVMQWENFTRSSGSILIRFSYDKEPLPSRIVFTFDVNGMNLPLKYFGNEVQVDKPAMKAAGSVQGSVRVDLSNYRIQYAPPGKDR